MSTASSNSARRPGFGKTPALLVVDFVNGFHDPEILGGGNIAEAVIATVPLLDFFRARTLPVIFTRIVYAEDGSDASLWCEKVPRLRGLTENAMRARSSTRWPRIRANWSSARRRLRPSSARISARA